MSSNETSHSHETRDADIHPLAKPFLFLDKPVVGKALLWIFLAGALGTLGMQIVYHFHPHGGPGDILGFYDFMGFFGFCFVVLMGWPLRALLARKPDYYAQEGDDE